MGNTPTLSAQPSLDVEDILSNLEISEKIALLSGVDYWHTAPVRRLHVPSIRFSDGPNGVRGIRAWNGSPAACLPCGTALAASWDTKLIQRGGELQGREAILKGVSVILGPTANMQRSPLGGRGFESFSEDPHLSGTMSAATIEGIQSTGVCATLKHFVCNDQEDQRQSINSILTERALREIYLMPFMIAQRDAKPACFMTSYNLVNGIHAAEHPKLLKHVLREEWGFDGLVISDWFGTYTTTDAIKTGLNLEMPGPSYTRGKLVNQALTCGKLTEDDVDQNVRKVLQLIKRVEALGIPEDAPECTSDTPKTAALLRSLASESIVLLKNYNNVLPYSREKTTAVIGPNAAISAYSGGGSATLLPYYAVSPLGGVRAVDPNAAYELGCRGWKSLPLMSNLTRTTDQCKGMTMSVFLDPPTTTARGAIDIVHVSSSDILLVDYKHPLIRSPLYWVELSGTFTPEETGGYDFSLTCAGTGKIFVDDRCVVDNETVQRPGDSFLGAGSADETGSLMMQEGVTYNIRVSIGTYPTMTFTKPGVSDIGAGGFRAGMTRIINEEVEIDKAVRLAKQVDQVILCAGLNKEWESEGWDRKHMDLPPGSDRLIEAVVAANPNTIVVIQSGTPVTMPWIDKVPAVLQAWYGGNEAGNAIADVIFGLVNPSGKLPLTFPIRNEDNPAFLNYKSERNRVLYGEDVYIGYRFYEKTKKPVLFPFGHGLSYTTFDFKDLRVFDGDDGKIRVSVSISNTGQVHGAQVVQIYVSQRHPSISRPPKELKGFAKVFLDRGETKTEEVILVKKYATSFWDETRDAWVMEKDTYDVLVGDSSASSHLQTSFEVHQTSWWRGLE